jgi:hypothetical protein
MYDHSKHNIKPENNLAASWILHILHTFTRIRVEIYIGIPFMDPCKVCQQPGGSCFPAVLRLEVALPSAMPQTPGVKPILAPHHDN